MTTKTHLIQFLVNYNSISESFTLKKNSKFQQLKMIVSGLFDIQDSDKIVFYRIDGQEIVNNKSDTLISDIFRTILSSDDIIELKIEIELNSEIEFIVIFNSQNKNFKLNENKTLLQLLEIVMSHFKEFDFNQIFKLIHNKINILDMYDVNKKLIDVVKELNFEKSNQIIFIVELENSLWYSSNNPKIRTSNQSNNPNSRKSNQSITSSNS